MRKIGLLISVGLFVALFLNGGTVTAQKAVKNVSELAISYDDSLGLDLSEDAKLILADTLKFNSMFDRETEIIKGHLPYASKYLLPLTFKGVVSPSGFRVKEQTMDKSFFEIYPEENMEWLDRDLRVDSLRESALSLYMARNPRQIAYDGQNMAAAPEQNKLGNNISDDIRIKVNNPILTAGALAVGLPKADRWKVLMKSSIQFSQNYISDNWYQGGESNVNILSLQNLFVKYYDENDVLEFETAADLKTGIYTTKSDTLRSLRVNDDLFQVNSKVGLKAIKKWYYTAAVNFKTQVFNHYETNSDKMVSKLLCPGEFNLSVGLDYKYQNKDKTVDWSLLVAPLSYNLKFVIDNEKIDETKFGIDEGKYALNQLGSSLTNKITWKITSNITWDSRLYYFSNYDKAQGDFENVFTFTVNKNFTTRIAVHCRYDDDTDTDVFQLKELLSFGLNYVW